jgi:hypothetical protein
MKTTALRQAREKGRAHRCLLEFRQGRAGICEGLGDWLLGRPPPESMLDRDVAQFYSDWGCHCDGCFRELLDVNTFDFEVCSTDLAIASLLDDDFEIQARAQVPHSDHVDVVPVQPVAEPKRVAPAGPLAEQRVLDWDDALAMNPLLLCKQVKRDPVERTALRVARQRTRAGGLYCNGEAGAAPRLQADWSRCVDLAVLSNRLWVRPISTWSGTTPRSLLDHVLCRYDVSDAVFRWFLDEPMHPDQKVAHASMARVWLVAQAQGVSVRKVLAARGWRLAEGTAQRHCAASYAQACATGQTAIFQLSYCQRRELTIEVEVDSKRIVQVRGGRNREATSIQADVVRRWAAAQALWVAAVAW